MGKAAPLITFSESPENMNIVNDDILNGICMTTIIRKKIGRIDILQSKLLRLPNQQHYQYDKKS